jgi:hypothetical protein
LCVACLNSSQISSFSSASMMPFTREFSVQFSSWDWKLKWCLILHFYSTVNENWLVASFGSSRCKAENWNDPSFCISTALSMKIEMLPHFAFLQYSQRKLTCCPILHFYSIVNENEMLPEFAFLQYC